LLRWRIRLLIGRVAARRFLVLKGGSQSAQIDVFLQGIS
jgi:hypothetical protein